jgi:NAD(P)-dependent dehydrogenase (short-subunit alcohol dehydrogenase family)
MTYSPANDSTARTNQLFSLAGYRALVTAACGGLGAEISRGLAEAGAAVLLTDVREDDGQALATSLSREGYSASFQQCDCSNPEDVLHAVSETISQLGGIDILVHVACAAKLGALATMPIDDIRHTFDSCLTSTFLMARAAGAEMIRQNTGGSIVLMSSIAGKCALGRGTSAYAASKAGVDALVRELAVEWAPYGIRVNSIAPCQFMTAGLEKVLSDPRFGGEGSLREKMISAIPMGRFGKPEEIVGPVTFLASRASSMVTGHTLYVDGGYTAK